MKHKSILDYGQRGETGERSGWCLLSKIRQRKISNSFNLENNSGESPTGGLSIYAIIIILVSHLPPTRIPTHTILILFPKRESKPALSVLLRSGVGEA